MLSLSAKTVNLSARPSPSVSSQMMMRSWPLPGGCDLVGIIDRLGDPQPAALVPVHADRLAAEICGSAANSCSSKPTGRDDVLHRLGRRRAAAASCWIGSPSCPAACRRIERERWPSTYSNGLTSLRERRHLGRVGERPATTRGIAADGPADAALDQILEAGVAPGAFVVAPGGVEDAALALRAHPGPRLLAVAFDAVFQDGAVLLVVLGVDVGFVPALEAAEALHDRMVRLGDGRCGTCRCRGCLNWAPTSSTYFGELRKQYEAQCSGMKPLPPATKSSSAFSCSGVILVVLA